MVFLMIILLSTHMQSQTPLSTDDGRTIKIPVIFHVIHSNRVYTPKTKYPHSSENISDDAILAELKDLNLDFMGLNDRSFVDPHFVNIMGNPNIEFHIADTILQVGGSKGIIRKFHARSTKYMYRVSDTINTKKYLNVYIGNTGNVTNLNGDWINLNFREIGTNTHVLTHEAGHWLGLYHIWGRIGSCSWVKTRFKRDDWIDDTPAQSRCSDLKRRECPPKNRAVKRGEKSNYNNFMDYSACRCMFTKKQAVKMRNQIILNRSEMLSN